MLPAVGLFSAPNIHYPFSEQNYTQLLNSYSYSTSATSPGSQSHVLLNVLKNVFSNVTCVGCCVNLIGLQSTYRFQCYRVTLFNSDMIKQGHKTKQNVQLNSLKFLKYFNCTVLTSDFYILKKMHLYFDIPPKFKASEQQGFYFEIPLAL